MVESTVFANRGAPVSVAAINEDRIDEMSLGELLYAQALFAQRAAARLAEPGALQEVATFVRGAGADWAGFHADDTPDDDSAAETHTTSDDAATTEALPEAPSSEPVAPDNYVDTLPAMLDLLDRAARVTDAAFAHLFGLVEAAHRNQEGYFGVPADAAGFKDPIEVLRQRLRMSRQQAKHHQTRAKYIAQTTATDGTAAGAVPQWPQVAATYTAGRVPTENVDKLIAFDAAAAEHATKTGQTMDYKNAVLEVFEPTLVAAAETDTPEELGKAKQAWLELLAYHIDPDGPPPVLTSPKQPDNALRLRNHADGSATASMHMDPMWAAFVKEFLNTNLNYRGNTPLLPENIQNLYEAMAATNKATQQAQDDQAANSGTATHDSPAGAAADAGTSATSTASADTGAGAATAADHEAAAPAGTSNTPVATEQSSTAPAELAGAAGTGEISVRDLEATNHDGATDAAMTAQEVPDPGTAATSSPASVADFHAAIGADPEPARRLANQIEQAHPHPVGLDEVVAEDDQGNPVTRRQVEWIDTLTRAQRAGSIILGALYRMMSLPPDAAVKHTHGSPAKLVVVQDIQTAYHTLGLPPVPAAVRRPTGPDGILPPTPPPDPGLQDDPAAQDDPESGFTGHANPVAWTPYQSAIVNVGPVHPASIQPGLCDVDLVGQIWNGDDIVLNEYRTKRLFTAAQRRAIFARDKGCQAPGCTVQATYCQCHHCKEWSDNGLTNEANAITLCARHHGDVHDGKWTIRKHQGRTYFQPAKWLDPTQPLLRNTYWNS